MSVRKGILLAEYYFIRLFQNYTLSEDHLSITHSPRQLKWAS